MEACDYKPHAVCIPCPFQSHIKGMLKLAKLLHHKGFHITFVNSEFNHRRFLKSRGHNSLDGFHSFQFEAIPEGLPASSSADENSSQSVPSFCENLKNNVMMRSFIQLLAKLNDNSNHPAVSCIISDGFLPFTITAGQQLGLPVVLLFTFSATGLMVFKQLRTLKEKGLASFEDESLVTKEYLDTVVNWIPGIKDIRIRDLPSFVRRDPNGIMFNFTMESVENASKASAIIIHTFDALEGNVLDALSISSVFPPLFSIGPLQILLNQINQQDSILNSIGYNLWKEETQSLEWLNSKEPNSVIYINFGSVVVMTKQQLIEVAMGLANSNHPFLWIIRPDLVTGDTTMLPSEFEDKAKGKCMIASWCPQEEVLNHPSIGGFFTHSGWNSTIECLSAGVPMICLPRFSDQMTNCRCTCSEWGVGSMINGEEVNRDEVEKLVRELMEGEKGKQMRNKALDWKKLAEEATAPHGSSSRNLEKLVNEILLPKECKPNKN